MKPIATLLAPLVGVSLIAATAMPNAALAHKHHDDDGCQAEKKKDQTNGMVIGAVGGAVAGNMISGKKHKGLGTVAGAVVGGVVGAKLGKDKVKCGHDDDAGVGVSAAADANVGAGASSSH